MTAPIAARARAPRPRSLSTPGRWPPGRWLLAFLPLAALQLGADTTGCRSESSEVVRQDRIWTGYWALHDEQGDTTDLRASFRLGSQTGTPLVLDAPAQVSFRGQNLSFDPVWDWHSTRLEGRVETGELSYRDRDGDVFTAPLRPFREARLPPGFPSAIDASEALTLTWDGPALRPDELVEVTLRSADSVVFRAFFQRLEGATDIVLDADGLGRLPRGPAVLVVRRTEVAPLARHPGAGGRVTMTWQSRERTVEIR